MSAFWVTDRGRWVMAALASGVLGLGFVLLFRPPVAETRVQVPSVKLPVGLGLRRVAPAEAALVDPTPLFLPTIWNTAQKDVALPKAGGAFANYPAKFAFEESEFKALQARSMAAANVLDVLALAPPGASMLGIGRQGRAEEPLQARGAFLEVTLHAGSSVVLKEVVPPLPFRDVGLWEPVEFLAVVDPAGLCGPLVSTVRSNADEIDAHFKNYVTNTVRLGAKLGPGIYRIRIGP